QSILTAANAVIDLASERYRKNLRSDRSSAERPQLVSLRDETDQAHYVAERILEHREAAVPLKQQAVLFRASHHSAPLEIELTRRSIPFVKFGGLKFLEAAHVKDVLAFYASRKTCATGCRVSGSSSFWRVLVRRRRGGFSTGWLRQEARWKRSPTSSRRPPVRESGQPSPKPFA